MTSSDSAIGLSVEQILYRMLFISSLLTLSCLSFCLGSIAITLLRVRGERDIEQAILPRRNKSRRTRASPEDVAHEACDMTLTRIMQET